MKTAIPKAAPTALPEIQTYLEPFADLFRRSPSRQSLDRYVTGLLSDLPHKTCQTIADAVAGTSSERLQHLLTDADWDSLALDARRVRQLIAVSPANGLLALDDTTFFKQGTASVGVARQYCGELGKVANCQTVVTAEYIVDDTTSSSPCHWPVTAQLYLPEAWLVDPERRARIRIPEDAAPHTKYEVALAVLDRAIAWRVPFQIVLADAGYGRSAPMMRSLEERQVQFVCGVDKLFGVRKPHEVASTPTQAPMRTGKPGAPHKAHPAPLYVVKTIVAALADTEWQTICWRAGPQGMLQRQFVALRMHWATGEAGRSLDDPRVYTSPEGWLIAERPIGGTIDDVRYYFSNLPAETRLGRLAALVRARWPIEQFYEDAKQECGLGDYQGRRWDGLHRHIALVMLAYSFLVYQRMSEAERSGGQFSVAVERPSLPSVHRMVLIWLLQDLVCWWVATDQISAFQARRL
jgi:SRSO17 transposase